jgi:hypothetical protein
MGFIARVDPSGGGVIGGAVYGASLLAGSTPEQAAFDAKLAETLLQAIIIGRGVKVSGDYMPQIEGPPAIPETVATPGGPNVGAPQPGGVAVYRGVHGKHPDLPNARRGKANPWGGSSTPEEHSNDGFVDSEFTSWTTDPGVAEFFARQRGPGGVILHDIIEPSEGHVTPLEKFQEYEILRRGPIRGVWVRRLK